MYRESRALAITITIAIWLINTAVAAVAIVMRLLFKMLSSDTIKVTPRD